ncbi:MAG: hypothetical protein SOU50_07900, partial [Oscillospiraceae bacterium]|nr:hypothetical protein [Oscillospiraceae bacterium]
MKGKIVGFNTMDYVSKKTNQEVKGVTLYLIVKSSDVIGDKVKEEFIKSDSSVYKALNPYLCGDIDSLIGADVTIDYNVEKRGNFTFTDICELVITPACTKEV